MAPHGMGDRPVQDFSLHRVATHFDSVTFLFHQWLCFETREHGLRLSFHELHRQNMLLENPVPGVRFEWRLQPEKTVDHNIVLRNSALLTCPSIACMWEAQLKIGCAPPVRV